MSGEKGGIGVLAMALVLAACSGPVLPEDSVEIEELARSTQSQVDNERMEVIRSPEGLAEAWARTDRSGEAPEVDFDRDMVVAVFIGEYRTGGHSVRVREAEATEEGVRLAIRVEAPGSGCMVTQAITRPYQIVKLPRMEGSVAFDITRDRVDCD